MILSPSNPVYNTIIIYLLLICIILLTKPDFMFCKKTNKFKTFGLGENQTLLSFPTISIFSCVILYVFFFGINIMHNFLTE